MTDDGEAVSELMAKRRVAGEKRKLACTERIDIHGRNRLSVDEVSRNYQSPWVGLHPGVDPVKWAALLRRAHSLALKQDSAPAVLRRFVANSWNRARHQGLDPDGCAPVALDAAATRRALTHHPVAHLLGGVQQMLHEATAGSKYLLALSDSTGVLLSVSGHPDALKVASEGGFEPGHLCSEQALGTNAVGTALELKHPVQIFSAEHFSRRLHSLTCSAAPIRDPETNCPIGVLNLSGDFRTCHPHSLALVSSVCRLVEETLVRELKDREVRLHGLLLDRVGSSGRRSAIVSESGRVVAAYPKSWLGRRLRIAGDGRVRLPRNVDARVEPLESPAGALFVEDLSATDARRSSRFRIQLLPSRRIRVSSAGLQVNLNPRHTEIIVALALHPHGLTGAELHALLPRADCKAVTVRAEISRLRKALGPVVLSHPYRLDPTVDVDRGELQRFWSSLYS